jgi:serine/threonine protein phosphatase PrpC
MASGQEPTIRYAAVGLTDVGRIREHNEDNFLAADLAAEKRGASGEDLAGPVRGRGLALVVADGMGGAAAGEVASQMAVDMLHEEFRNADLGGTIRTEPLVITLLETAIHKANEAIFRKGQDSKEHQGMGTTLTAAVVLGDSLYLSQVGDSRGYILRKGKLVQMTRDQSLIGQLIEEGTLTEEQAEKLGGKNIILQALGVEETLKIDSKRYDILQGDTLLLCSDGLSGMVPDAKIEEILASERDLPRAARGLIEAANAGGGKDNITCILARFEGEGLREPLSPLTTAEKAGGTFHAPPPPKSKAGRNAAVATAAVVALAAIVIFWPRKKEIEVNAGPVPGTATIRPVEEGAFSEEKLEFVPGTPVRFKAQKGTRVEIVVEAPGYTPQRRVVDTDVEQTISESFNLVRVPAKSLDMAPPPYRGGGLSRVKVKLAPKEGQRNLDQALEARDGGAPEYKDEFPAGKWRATATRPGFKPLQQDFDVASGKPEVLRLGEMEEVFGNLTVSDIPAGAKVTVLDEEEAILPAPVVADAGRKAGPLKVRATRLTVRIEAPGYAFDPQTVEVAEGADAKASCEKQKAKVTLAGPPDGSLTATHAGTGQKERLNINADGKSRPQYVLPGGYTGTYTSPDGAKKDVKFEVEPGRILELDVQSLGQ